MPEGNFNPEAPRSIAPSESRITPGQSGIEAPQSLPHQTLPDVTHHPLQHGGLEAAINPPVKGSVIGMSERGKPIYAIAGGSTDDTSESEVDEAVNALASELGLDPSDPRRETIRRGVGERLQAEAREAAERRASEDVGKNLGDFRKERYEIVEKARQRTLEQAQAEAKTEEYRQKAIAEAKARMEKRNEKARKARIERATNKAKAKARDQGKVFNEGEVDIDAALKDFEPEEFNEAEFEVEPPSYIWTELIQYEAEEQGRINEINEKMEVFVRGQERGLEFLTSKEWGKSITERIIHWEAMVDEGRYAEIDWEKLDKAYEDQIIHIEASRIVKSSEKPESSSDGSRKRKEPSLPLDPEKLKDLSPERLAELIEITRSNRTQGVDMKMYDRDVDAFLEEAKRIGLLKELDSALSSIYDRDVVSSIRRGLSLKHIRFGDPRRGLEGMEQQIADALESVVEIYRARNDENIHLLAAKTIGNNGEEIFLATDRGREIGVWDLYAELARRRFINAIDRADDEGVDTEPYRLKHEFHLIRQEGIQETFWGLSPSGYYIEIYARTPQEYEIAGETYITDLMARTSDPQEIFQEAQEFIRTIDRSAGRRSPEFLRILRELKGPDATEQEFISKLIKKIQARLGVFGADHSNELYKGDQYKQFMDYMAKDGDGPVRWLLLAENPDVALALWKMDNDPRFKRIMFAVHGARGQLSADTAAQRTRDGDGLYWQIEEILVEEVLGTRWLNDRNVARSTGNLTAKKFTTMYEGLYRHGRVPEGGFQGDGNIRLYQKYGNNLKEVPKELRSRWRLGKIQLALIPEKRGGGGLTLDNLDPADREFYRQSLAKAKEAVRIAMQMYGALGEKSKRGGGVFKVRKVDAAGKEYFDFVETHLGEKFVQFAEAMTEVKYADDSDVWSDGSENGPKNDVIGRRIRQRNKAKGRPEFENFKARYRAAKVAQASEKARDEFAGVEHEVIYDDKGNPKKDGQGGYVLRRLEESEKNKEGRKGKNIVRKGGKGFESKLSEYYASGKRIGSMRLNRPLEIINPETGEDYRPKKGEVIGYSQSGQPIRLTIDDQGKLIGVEIDYDQYSRAIIFDKPGGKRINDHLRADTLYEFKGEDSLVAVERVTVDFAIATNHILADWTAHTYRRYKEEDRHQLLSPLSFAQARLVLEGVLSPEEVDEWARQLLKLDPTLCRVGKFTESKMEDRERKLTMAAVEHKYQSHWRISRELHRAFFPTFATPVEFNGLYYGLQDFGGFRKMLESVRARVGEDEERFARRGRRLTPDLHIPYASASEMWGVGTQGALGVLRMMALPVYRGVGTFALDKFAAQSEVAYKMYQALIENRNSEGGYEEALLLKLTNLSDKLSNLRGGVPNPSKFNFKTIYNWREIGRSTAGATYKNQNDFAYAVIESLGRYKRYIALFPLMETAIRNASGALWLAQDEEKATDIILEGGRVDTSEARKLIARLSSLSSDRLERDELEDFIRNYRKVEVLSEKRINDFFNSMEIDQADNPNTGSGRHSGQIFHDTFIELLLDEEYMGGGRLYAGERYVYRRINDNMLEYDENGNLKNSTRTIADFVLEKILPT